MRRWLRAWREHRANRRELHNDRDVDCKYWWGDRGGYILAYQQCLICNPEGR